MTQDEDKRDGAARTPSRRAGRKPEAAFDLWLTRGLHKLFDEVAKEPIPDELLRLIEDDKGQHSS